MIRLVVHNCALDVTDRQVAHQCKGDSDFIKFALLGKRRRRCSVRSPDRCRDLDERLRRRIAGRALPHPRLDFALGLLNDGPAKLSIFPIGGFELLLHFLAGR